MFPRSVLKNLSGKDVFSAIRCSSSVEASYAPEEAKRYLARESSEESRRYQASEPLDWYLDWLP